MDDFILPGKPGGVRKVVDIGEGEAAKIRIPAGGLMGVGDVALHFEVAGDYIVVPLATWAGLLRKIMGLEQALLDAALPEGPVERLSRQAKRAKDRRN